MPTWKNDFLHDLGARRERAVARNDDPVERLVDQYVEHRIDRRQFFKRAAALGISVSAAGTLLAACGGGGDGAETAATSAGGEATTAAATTAAATTEAAGEPVVGGILLEGYDRDVSRLDPVATTWWDASLFPAVHETVVTQDAEGAFIPMIAESWDQSEDGSTLTFTIRDGLTFQGGSPCDAAAVAAALNVIRQNGINAGFWTPVTDVAADGNTVVVTMDHPYADLLYVLNSGYSAIFDNAVREELGDNYGVTACDGTGPFTLTELVPGSHCEVARWDGYAGPGADTFTNQGTAYLDGVRWVVLLEPATRAQELEAGNIQALHGPAPQDVDRLKENSDFAVIEFQEWSLYQLGLNYDRTELGFDDVKVRQAFMHAIDRQAIVDSIFFGKAAPSYTIVPSAFPFYDPAVEEFGTFDADLAASLLDEAGWTAGGDGIREKNGTKLSFETVTEAYDKTEGLVAQAVQEMLKNVGIDLQIKPTNDFFTEKGILVEGGPTAYMIKNVWPYMFDASLLFTDSNYILPACCNVTFTRIPELDQAYAEWQAASNEEELSAAAKKACMIAAEQVAFVPIVTPLNVWVHTQAVHGWAPNQPNLYPFYNDVWIES
jgi:peptide/nickel transport system substrate-binding protein